MFVIGGIVFGLLIIAVLAGVRQSLKFFKAGAVGLKKTVIDQDGDNSYEYHPYGCSCASCIAY